jgi:hypothetical protein
MTKLDRGTTSVKNHQERRVAHLLQAVLHRVRPSWSLQRTQRGQVLQVKRASELQALRKVPVHLFRRGLRFR